MSKVVASKGKGIRFYVFIQKHRSGYGIAAEVLTTTVINAKRLIGAALGRTPPDSQIEDYSGVDWWYIAAMKVGEVKHEGTAAEIDRRAKPYYFQWAQEIMKRLQRQKLTRPSRKN